MPSKLCPHINHALMGIFDNEDVNHQGMYALSASRRSWLGGQEVSPYPCGPSSFAATETEDLRVEDVSPVEKGQGQLAEGSAISGEASETPEPDSNSSTTAADDAASPGHLSRALALVQSQNKLLKQTSSKLDDLKDLGTQVGHFSEQLRLVNQYLAEAMDYAKEMSEPGNTFSQLNDK
eukprot:4377080-Amphidinium_carterae.1